MKVVLCETHFHASIGQQEFIGRLLLMSELNVPSKVNISYQVSLNNREKNLQSNSDAYQQRQTKNQVIPNTKHSGSQLKSL